MQLLDGLPLLSLWRQGSCSSHPQSSLKNHGRGLSKSVRCHEPSKSSIEIFKDCSDTSDPLIQRCRCKEPRKSPKFNEVTKIEQEKLQVHVNYKEYLRRKTKKNQASSDPSPGTCQGSDSDGTDLWSHRDPIR